MDARDASVRAPDRSSVRKATSCKVRDAARVCNTAMNFKRTALFCLLIISLNAHSTRAQTAPPDDKAKTEQAARAAALERKALALLDEIGEDARALKLAENRVRVQVATADMLWLRDEKRAREIINDALMSLASVTSSISPDDPRVEQQTQEMANLRREIMQTIAQRDPQLALDFLRATRPPLPAPPAPGNYQPDQELALEASLAEQVAARDPKQALRFAEETLSRGVSTQLTSVLERLRYTNAEDAARLASEIARKLRSTNLATNYEATNVVAYLLRTTRASDANGARIGSGGAAVDNQPLIALDDQTRRDLLMATVNAALSASNDPRTRGMAQNLASMLQQFMPEIERALPAQAQSLRRISLETTRATIDTRVGQQQREYQTLMQTGTVDALLDAASKSPPEMRDQLYRAAAYKALSDGTPDRARQIVADHYENAQQRAQLLRDIDQQLFWRASNAGDVGQARAIIARLTRPEERAGLLIQLARTVANKGDKEGARQLLEEVWNQIGGQARNQQQFASQLEAAQVFAQVAPDRSFEIVESSVAQLNELISAASVVDGFGQQAFDQDELKAQGGYMWSGLVNQCGIVLAALARTDFERAVATADHLQRLETRHNARLAVARGVLGARDDTVPRGRTFGRGGSAVVVRN
jgi:hypothetical protein